MTYQSATPDDIVARAVAADLDLIAITDHNTAHWCDRVRDAALSHPLTVLPGTELSTPEGHLLAIFDPEEQSSTIDELLVECGIGAADFGRLDVATTLHIEEVAKHIHERGGVAIAAHVDTERGFQTEVAVGARRRTIEDCQHIAAFETHAEELAKLLMSGRATVAGRKVAAIDASDSWTSEGERHRLEGIGSRYCYLKMDDLGIGGLTQAFVDPEIRLLRGGAVPAHPELAIESLAVTEGFLKDQTLRFSENITCLIGGTGAGKSLTLELARFALNQQVDQAVLPTIRREVDNLLAYALPDAAKVSVVVRRRGTHYLVERVWLATGPTDPVVFRLEGGTPTMIDSHPDLQTFFPIKGFSQGEIIEYSRETLARLVLVDDLIDIEQEQLGIAALKSALRENAAAVLEAERRSLAVSQELRQVPTVEEEIKSLERYFSDPRVANRRTWEQERRVLSDAKEALHRAEEVTDDAFAGLDARLVLDPPSEPVNPDILDGLGALQGRLGEAFSRTNAAIKAALSRFQSELEGIQQAWQGRFAEADAKYRAVLVELDRDGQGRAALATRLDELRDRRAYLEGQRRLLDERLRPAAEALADVRNGQLTQLQAYRKSITTKRQEKARELTEKLEGRVRITVKRDADGRKFLASLRELKIGSNVHDTKIATMSGTLHPIPLVKSMLSRDFASPAAESGLEPMVFEKLADNVLEGLVVGVVRVSGG